jgi:hypothetical protein
MLGSDGHIAVDIGVVPTGSSYLILNGADGSFRVAFKMGFGDKPVLNNGRPYVADKAGSRFG